MKLSEFPNHEKLNPQKLQVTERPKPCSVKCVVCNSVIILLRLFFILAGISLQLITCFRRDLITTNLIQIPDTDKKQLSCDNKNQIICALMIPDIVIFLLAVWVYAGLRFAHRINQCSLIWLEFKEVSTIMEADTAANLNELVRAVRSKGPATKQNCPQDL